MRACLRDEALHGRGILVRFEVDAEIGRDVHIRPSSVIGERFSCRTKPYELVKK
jgi:hypothetical protein